MRLSLPRVFRGVISLVIAALLGFSPQSVNADQISLIILLDKSGSMKADDKLRDAKVFVSEMLSVLSADDEIGLIAYDSSPFVVVRLGLVEEVRAKIEKRLTLLYPSNVSNLAPALLHAGEILKGGSARRSIFVVTDGKLPTSDSSIPHAVKELWESGTSTSFIQIGDDGDWDYLTRLAERGGGFFSTDKNGVVRAKQFLRELAEKELRVIGTDVKEKGGDSKVNPPVAEKPVRPTKGERPGFLRLPTPTFYKIIRDTDVYREPNSGSKPVQPLLIGDKIEVHAETRKWLEIRSKRGKFGYVQSIDAFPIGS